MTPLILLLAAALTFAGGLVVLRRNGPGWRVGRLLRVAPLRTLAAARELAEAGDARYISLHARIDSDEEFSGDDDKPIVFRRRRLQRRAAQGGWTTFDDERLTVPFGLTDKGDTVMIDTDALGDGLVVVPRLSEGTADDIPGDAFSGEPIEMPADTPVRMRLEQVSSVDHATAAGVPVLGEDGTTLLTSGLGRPLILTTLDPEEAMRVLGSDQRNGILLATVLFSASAIILLAVLIVVLLGL